MTKCKNNISHHLKSHQVVQFLLFLMLFVGFYSCKSTGTFTRCIEKNDIISKVQGDLNDDGNLDYAVITKKDNDIYLSIFIVDTNDVVLKSFINKHLVQSFMEQFDTRPDIEINKNELSVSQYGGMCHRESKTVTFTFNKEKENLFFEYANTSSHNVCNDEEPRGEIVTSPELRNIKFSDYIDEY